MLKRKTVTVAIAATQTKSCGYLILHQKITKETKKVNKDIIFTSG